MGLRVRFNLVLTVVFLLGLALSGYVSYGLLQSNARADVVRNAELMIESAKEYLNDPEVGTQARTLLEFLRQVPVELKTRSN